MANISSILNHADFNLHKAPDFTRVPVELKKEERQLNLKVSDVDEKKYLQDVIQNEKGTYLFSASVYLNIYHEEECTIGEKEIK